MAFNTDPAGSRVVCGLDFGTSGARISVLPVTAGHNEDPLFEASRPWGPAGVADTAGWAAALRELCEAVPASYRERTVAVAVDGTSSSVLLADASTGLPLTDSRMYNWDAKRSAASLYERSLKLMDDAKVPPEHTVRAPTSTLAKVLAWLLERPFQGARVVHQVDFVNSVLLGTPGFAATDWHNALKLGFDVGTLSWPAWLEAGPLAKVLDPSMLPRVVRPGSALGKVGADFDLLPSSCIVAAGTTDSIAAFLACGVSKPGEAVTSLGSTLAIKMLSRARVDDASRGIYSHRLWEEQDHVADSSQALWLVGGASNVGCAVLRAEGFGVDEISERSSAIDPSTDSPLDYYPLTQLGERFPICDPDKQPVMTPVPECRTERLHGLLQGIARVERDGYMALGDLGADTLRHVFTAGGGAANDVWGAMRSRLLGVPVSKAPCVDAAAGAARLAIMSAARDVK